jgi:hypothetical protein
VPSAGAEVAAESADIEVESPIAGAVVSVLVSVVVVLSPSAAGFDSQEVRAAANTKARADTFRKFFIFGVRFEKLSKKRPSYRLSKKVTHQ